MLYSKVFVAVLMIPMCLMAYASWGAYEKMERTNVGKFAVAAELSALEARKESLQHEIERLESPLGLEEEVRQKYEVGRVGEKMIVLVDEKQEISGAETPQEDTRSVWQKIFGIFQ